MRWGGGGYQWVREGDGQAGGDNNYEEPWWKILRVKFRAIVSCHQGGGWAGKEMQTSPFTS